MTVKPAMFLVLAHFLKDFEVTCNRTLPLFVVCDVGNPMDPNQTVSKIYLVDANNIIHCIYSS